LAAPATDVAFLASGLAGYVVDSNGVVFSPTCDAGSATLGDTVAVSGATMIRPLPNALNSTTPPPSGNEMLVLAPPNADIVTATVSGSPVLGSPGCPDPRGFVTISNSVTSPVGFGQGSSTAHLTRIGCTTPVGRDLVECGTGITCPLQTPDNSTAASQDRLNRPYPSPLAADQLAQAVKGVAIAGMANAVNTGTFLVPALGG